VFSSFYLNRNIYFSALFAAALFVLSFFFAPLFSVAVLVLAGTVAVVLADAGILYSKKSGVSARRVLQPRFSNGDENKVTLQLHNRYPFKCLFFVLDELPFQLSQRAGQRTKRLLSGEETELNYFVRPTDRGEYTFGNINIFVSSPLRTVKRRYVFKQPETVKVYPSFFQMRRYQLLAVAHRLHDAGVKRARKLGHSIEFEQIKEYVPGDDYRTINWKATARHSGLMTNNFADEQSGQIYCLVNKGRIMKMPFEGLSLLDYAINATLVLSNVALLRQDRVGLITFANGLETFLPADKKPAQLSLILESLHNQTTNFLETDFEQLFSAIRNKITQRSLLVLFTNFESLEALRRALPFLKKIAHYHLLMVVFFENTELKQLIEQDAQTIEDIYIKTIAEKYHLEKKLMVAELRRNGIVALLTPPKDLTINALNKYLELKSRQRS